MTVDDLVICDLEGNVLEGDRRPTSEKTLHLECFRRYDHVGAVIHCHPIYATMFAVTHQPIPAVIEEFIVYVGGDVPCAPYRQTGSDDLGRTVAEALDGKHATLMANHGLLACGANPEKALHTAELVERTAQVDVGSPGARRDRPSPGGDDDHLRPLLRDDPRQRPSVRRGVASRTPRGASCATRSGTGHRRGSTNPEHTTRTEGDGP